jgi:class 3 adenylate cyclase
MYQDCGDGKALDVVRLHFKILFSAFAKYGRIVKTVGDAVMGAFTCGEAAIRAVAMSLDAMQGKVLRPCGSQLSIRVGIHAGPVLMVPLNGINDYFGQTVNIAARVESKAGDGECLVSEAVLQESTAKAALDELYERGYGHTRDVDLVLKGVEGKVHAKGFQSRLAT